MLCVLVLWYVTAVTEMEQTHSVPCQAVDNVSPNPYRPQDELGFFYIFTKIEGYHELQHRLGVRAPPG